MIMITLIHISNHAHNNINNNIDINESANNNDSDNATNIGSNTRRNITDITEPWRARWDEQAAFRYHIIPQSHYHSPGLTYVLGCYIEIGICRALELFHTFGSVVGVWVVILVLRV